MKTLIVRLSVLALATTGFAAATVTSKATPKNKVIAPSFSSVCPPQCAPHSPGNCGFDTQ